jgi:hypothetical protein
MPEGRDNPTRFAKKKASVESRPAAIAFAAPGRGRFPQLADWDPLWRLLVTIRALQALHLARADAAWLCRGHTRNCSATSARVSPSYTPTAIPTAHAPSMGVYDPRPNSLKSWRASSGDTVEGPKTDAHDDHMEVTERQTRSVDFHGEATPSCGDRLDNGLIGGRLMEDIRPPLL